MQRASVSRFDSAKSNASHYTVIPAKAGTQAVTASAHPVIPAKAGTHLLPHL